MPVGLGVVAGFYPNRRGKYSASRGIDYSIAGYILGTAAGCGGKGQNCTRNLEIKPLAQRLRAAGL